MGVEREKSSLLRKLMVAEYHRSRPVPLIDKEEVAADQMTAWIVNAVAQAIEHQPFVSSNVLCSVMARVTAMVMKLEYDMFGFSEELFLMLYTIEKEWDDIKDKKIDYGDCVGSET